jgi:hypothetical protein
LAGVEIRPIKTGSHKLPKQCNYLIRLCHSLKIRDAFLPLVEERISDEITPEALRCASVIPYSDQVLAVRASVITGSECSIPDSFLEEYTVVKIPFILPIVL